MNSTLKRLISESSDPYTLSVLLEAEEEAQKAISTAQKAFQVRNTQLASLVGSLPSGKYKDVLGTFVKAVSDGTTEVGDAIEDADTEKETKGAAGTFDTLNKSVKQVLGVNIALMKNLAKIVVNGNLHKGDQKDIPLVEILKDNDLYDKTKKELDKAANTVETISVEPKGFLAKMMAAAFGTADKVTDLVGEITDRKDELIDGILEMTPLEIGKFAQEIVNYGKKDEKAEQQIDSANKEAAEAAEDLPATDDPEDAEAAEEAAEETDGEAGDESGGDESGEGDSEDKAPIISRDDIIAKVKANNTLGDAGAEVVKRMIDGGLFDDFGIKVENAIRRRSLLFLAEEKLAADEFAAAYELAVEEQPDLFQDKSPEELVAALNDVFADSNIDIQIEVPDIEEPELTAKKTDDGILVPTEAEPALEKAGIKVEESLNRPRLIKLAGIEK